MFVVRQIGEALALRGRLPRVQENRDQQRRVCQRADRVRLATLATKRPAARWHARDGVVTVASHLETEQ
ncbi:hypothetical protein C7T35_07500 [Variovorax sp. WS11]|nr:hypothetical protein C7T35_07500 [Variovorax sp. WS11]